METVRLRLGVCLRQTVGEEDRKNGEENGEKKVYGEWKMRGWKKETGWELGGLCPVCFLIE